MMMKSFLGSVGLAIALVASVPASAVVFTTSGDTTSGLTYNRPVPANFPTTLSGTGTAVRYNTLSFTVSTAGSYDFLMTSTTSGFDPFISLYRPTFNPSAPLTNALVARDDFGAPPFNTTGFSRSLLTGTNYFLVFTGFNNQDFGTYDLTINGPGTVTPGAGAVPEPATWAMMIGGFGAVGFAMRRRQKVTTRISYTV
jgi:hypothetical protein